MISGAAAPCLCLWLWLAPGVQAQAVDDRLYGRVTLASGEVLEGWLRWDRNETQWADLLDGRKEIPREHSLEAERLDDELRARRERERSVTFQGVRITWDENDGEPPERTDAAVRFGQLASVEVTGERTAVAVLTSGARLELVSGSTDVGRSFRGVIVEDAARAEREAEWEDLSRVDFMTAPPGRAPPAAERLHGTLETRHGARFTGFVAWDLDETLTTDVLDAERDGEDVRIALGDIRVIARESGASARVTLASGEQLVLGGSNDVDSDMRGIEVTDPSFGRAVTGWDDFASLTFGPATATPEARREGFVPGGRLRGTVLSRDGRSVSGLLRWDNDEEYAWEVLDGRSEGVDLAIELGRVRAIQRAGLVCLVTLVDGRSFLLDDAGDVGEDNRGIFVEVDGGETVLVPWRDFAGAVLEP